MDNKIDGTQLELNRIYNTDCLQFMKQLPDKCIDLVLTDPPYGMNLDTDWSSCKSNLKFINDKKAFGGNKYDRVIGDDVDFNPAVIMNKLDYVKEQFWFGADYYCKNIPDIKDGSWLVWDKRLTDSFELIWSKSKHKRDILRYKWAGIFGMEKQDIKTRVHPNQKPIFLIEYLIDKYTEHGDVVFDPFMGSGTTAVACERLGRQWLGCEISPEYCKIAEERIKMEKDQLKFDLGK